MIKIAMISDDPGIGGAYKVAHDIADGLPKDKFECQFIFLCEPPQDRDAPEGIYVGSPNFQFDYTLMSYIRLAFIPKQKQLFFEPLQNAIKSFDPDIIHSHTHIINLLLIKSFSNKTTRIFYTDHSQRIRSKELGILKTKLMSYVFGRLMENIHVVFVSKYAYKTAIENGYGNETKDYCIQNSVNIRIFNRTDNKSEKKKVAYIARICNGKGHDLLLDAWKKIPSQNDLELNLYGATADNGHIQRRIAGEEFPNPIYYRGVTVEPAIVLKESAIGVYPSYREGMPLALLEMMSTGLPVVASDIPEISSILTHTQDGLLFKCGNAIDLAKQLSILIADCCLSERLGANARQTVCNKYSTPPSLSYGNLYRQNLNH